MLVKSLDRIGDWNPQLLREIKGHLKLRNGIIVAASSLLIQGFLCLSFSRQICHSYEDNLGTCTDMSWEFNWLGIFRSLDWIFPLSIFAIGVYVLVANMVQEERQGTLNFIRLSPQSSESILLGKMLGVPLLVYLGIVLALPLHLGAGIVAGIPLSWTIAFYALVSAVCGFLYCAVLLNASLTQAPYQAIASSFLGAWLGSSFIGLLEFQLDWEAIGYREWGNFFWFIFPIGNKLILLNFWLLITISVATYWLWQSANRMFRNPNKTLLSKQQSYWLVGSFEFWLLGLFWSLLKDDFANKDQFFGYLFGVSIVTLILLLGVIYAISPQRQDLLDWARYGDVKSQQSKVKVFNVSWVDWLGGKRSPSVVAIAFNLAITGAIWLPWVLLLPVSIEEKIKAIAGLILSANLILIYAIIGQLMLLAKRAKPGIWAASLLSVVILLPLLLLAESTNRFFGVWMFSVFGAPWFVLPQASVITVFLSILSQWAVMAGLNFYLTRQLRLAGESVSKAMFVGHKS